MPPVVTPAAPRPVLASVLLIAAATLAACSRTEPTAEPVRAVKVITVGAAPVESGLEYAGEVKARVESRLSFRVGGKITQRKVDVGQRVTPGQWLAQIDPQDYQLAAEAARAQLNAATSQRDLAAADFKRYQALRDQNFISGAELERREATLKAAQATLDQARAQLSVQGHQAGYTRLLADAAGLVTAVEAEAGQVVAAGATVVRIAQDGPRDVVFAVPEDRVATIRVGAPVAVRAWAGGRSFEGMVREVAGSADPATRTFAVKVALAGSDVPPLGATVSVLPKAAGAQGVAVLKLPTAALRQEGAGTAVWVLEPASMTVRSQKVEIATADGNEVVIASGLAPGMQVVSAGVHVLTPGQKVTIYQPKGGIVAAAGAKSAMNSGASGSAGTTASASVAAPVAASVAVPASAASPSASR